ncbi:MAG: hypothetical protein GY754_37560 [bacterium]|nr:hypothetical protein [bacterium]
MIKKILGLGILTVVVLSAGYLFAGYALTNQVYVNNTASSPYAHGALQAARNSSDTTQYIGCYNYTLTGTPGAACIARDSSGNTIIGSTTNADLIETIRSASGTSAYVYFRLSSSSSSELDYVYTNNFSYNIE